MLRLLSIFLLAGFALAAQTIGLTGPASVRPGGSIAIDVALGSSNGPVGIQWTLPTPAGWTATRTAGAAATATQKQLSCHEAICLLYGLNQTSIQSGTVASYQYAIPANAAPGRVTLTFSEVMASAVNGAPAPLTAGLPHEIAVLAKSDIDGDGSTSITDVQLIDAQARGIAACADDQTGDGRCTIHDVVLVVVDYLKGLIAP